MKEEIKRWWNQAIEDLDTAQANLGIKNIMHQYYFVNRQQKKP